MSVRLQRPDGREMVGLWNAAVDVIASPNECCVYLPRVLECDLSLQI